MHISAIISEYNPFHNGHAYHIKKTRDLCATHIISIMSGNFVQRADISIISKYKKAQIALNEGVDLVIELPICYSTATASKFAFNAVNIASSLNCVDSLSFGSECGDINLLKKAANYIQANKTYSHIKNYLDKGFSFSKSRSLAVRDLYGEEISSILDLPNNILAIEYLRALKNLNSNIKPITFKRNFSFHDSDIINENHASASYIRNLIYNNRSFDSFLPMHSKEIINEQINLKKAPASINKLEVAILAKLRTMTVKELSLLPDISEGLENKLYKSIRVSTSLNELYNNTKTKRYSHSRIRRIVLCAFLGITKDILEIPNPYIRVLGFNDNGKDILKIMKNTCPLPIVMKNSDVTHLDSNSKLFWNLECKSFDIYSLAIPKADVCGLNMSTGCIII